MQDESFLASLHLVIGVIEPKELTAARLKGLIKCFVLITLH